MNYPTRPLIPLAELVRSPTVAAPQAPSQAAAPEPAAPKRPRRSRPTEDDSDATINAILDRFGIDPDVERVTISCRRRMPNGEFESLPEIPLTEDVIESCQSIEQLIGTTFGKSGYYTYRFRLKQTGKLSGGSSVNISKDFDRADKSQAETPAPVPPPAVLNEEKITRLVSEAVAVAVSRVETAKSSAQSGAERLLEMMLREQKENSKTQIEILLKRLDSQEKMTANLLDKIVSRLDSPQPNPAPAAASFDSLADQIENFSRVATAIDKVRGRQADENADEFDDDDYSEPEASPVPVAPSAPPPPSSFADRLVERGLGVLEQVATRAGTAVEDKLVEMVVPGSSPRKFQVIENPNPPAAASASGSDQQWDQLVGTLEGWAKSNLPFDQVYQQITALPEVADNFTAFTPAAFAEFLASTGRRDLASRIMATNVKSYIENVQRQMSAKKAAG